VTFNPEQAKAMYENYQKSRQGQAKPEPGVQRLRFGQYADGGIILEGDPPLISLKEKPGETFTPGTLSVFHPHRGWIEIKEPPRR